MLSQPDLIKKLLRQFEKKVENLKKTNIPAPASSHVVRCKEEEEGLIDEQQKEYRSGSWLPPLPAKRLTTGTFK